MSTSSFHPGPADPTPEQRLFMLNEDSWEEFIEVCVRQLKHEGEYIHVHRLGGAGDKGRDVCGYCNKEPLIDSWDLYQAKFYRQTLSRSQFLSEVAKFITNVYNDEFTRPLNYYICALKVGTSLFDLVHKPKEMKRWLLDQWKGKKGNFPSFKQPLTSDLQKFIEKFPFSIFSIKTPSDLLDIHSRNETKHWEKFGVLAKRGPNPSVPASPEHIEEKYISELLKVYGEQLRNHLLELSDLDDTIYNQHLNIQRRLFYCAEGLNKFSRDKLPGAFDDLLDQIELGTATEVLSNHSTGYDCLNSVLNTANTLKVNANPLKERLHAGDLQGGCHHLVNLDRLRWLDEE